MNNFWNIGNQQFARTIGDDVVSFGADTAIFTRTKAQMEALAQQEIYDAISKARYDTHEFTFEGKRYRRDLRHGRKHSVVNLDAEGNPVKRAATEQDWSFKPGQMIQAWEDIEEAAWKEVCDQWIQGVQEENERDAAERFASVPDDALFFQLFQERCGQNITNNFWAVPK